MTAFARGSVAVGDLLIDINDEGGCALIPLACLVEAAHKTAMLEQNRLEVLVDHPATFLIADDPDDWPALAAMRNLVERHDLASAAWLGMDAQVDVMTSDPRWYAGVNNGGDVLEFEPGE